MRILKIWWEMVKFGLSEIKLGITMFKGAFKDKDDGAKN